jgi:copper transport protein
VVTLTFSEPVNLPADAAQLFDAQGEQLEAAASGEERDVLIDVPDQLAAGTYVVTWRVVSADGHPITGSLAFSVERPSPTVVPPKLPETPTSTLRLVDVGQGIQYAGLLLAAGLVAFLLVVLPVQPATEGVRPRLLRLAGIAGAVAAVAALLLVPLSGARQLGKGPSAVFSADTWDLGALGNELLVAALITVGLAAAVWALRQAPQTPTTQTVAASGAFMAVAAPSVVGHTRAYDPESILIASDIVHLAAGAVWLGGLVGLVLTLPVLSRREGLAAETLTRFSVLAASSLGVLVLMGSLLAWRILASWDNLFGTRYGTLLLIKIGIVAVVALVAAANRYRLLPKLRDALGHAEGRRATELTRRAVGAEAALVVGVLLLTGFLVDQPPREATPVVPEGRTGVEAQTVGDVRILATVAPARVGQNQVRVQLQDLTGEPIETTKPPKVSVRSESVDLGRVRLRNVDAGTWLAEVILPEPGTWQVQVSVRVSAFENPVTTVEFAVS